MPFLTVICYKIKLISHAIITKKMYNTLHSNNFNTYRVYYVIPFMSVP